MENNAASPASQEKSMGKERRQFIRPESLNLLDYLVIDDKGRQGEHSMGRTLNVSEGGILMETRSALAANWKVMITLGLDEELVDILGKVIRSTPDGETFHNGVKFIKVSAEKRATLQRYVKAFNEHFADNDGNADG